MRAFSLVLFMTLAALSLHAQDWNQWRGPSRTGVTAAFKAPAVWPDRMKQIYGYCDACARDTASSLVRWRYAELVN